MGKIIGVQFQKNGKLYYFDANGFEVRIGDFVIVDTARGLDLGEVAMGTRETDEETWKTPLKKTVRIATEQDIQHGRDNRQKEKEAFTICQKKIQEHKLEMKLVSVEYAFDNSKILFFFTANGRVDFRSLVKDLASIFKMRIELRQIGVRDEAKMLGGLGPCGRPICCGTFLDQFQPVSIKMAKEQNLSLNPTKISGVCGRLMCCLKYEQEHYEQTRKRMPKIGKEVITPDGNGPVTDLNIVKETVFVRLTNGDTSEIKEYPLEQITRIGGDPHSEQGRKGPEKTVSRAENKPARNGDELPQEESGFPEPRGDEPAPEKADETGTDENETGSGRDRNRNRRRRGVLGQPVRRENPNRTQAAPPDTDRQADKAAEAVQESAPVDTAASKPEDKTKPEPDTAPKSGNSWADAVQKAMQAMKNS